MDILFELVNGISWNVAIKTCLRILLVLFFAWLVLFVVSNIIQRLESRMKNKGKEDGEPPSETEKRVETLFRLVRQGIRIVVLITTALVILKELGVDIGPVLAGAGIIGLAIGFGAQNLVRDIISGFFIILENQVRIGDVAIINGTGGLVERINFRTIILRDLSGVVHIFPNGTVTTLSNMTKEWSAYLFEIGVAYKENTDHVVAILKDVCAGMRTDTVYKPMIIEDAEIMGVDQFADSAVIIKGRIKTKPIRQWTVGREFLRRVKLAFDENGIEIPFPHRTVYFGEASKPFDVQLLEKLKKQDEAGE